MPVKTFGTVEIVRVWFTVVNTSDDEERPQALELKGQAKDCML